MPVPGIDSSGRSTLLAMFPTQLYLDSLATECAVIAELASSDTLDLAVAHCDGQSVGEVVRHLGDVHRWCAEIVQPGQIVGPEPEQVPDDELRSWFEEGATLLGAALASVEPGQPCWTFDLPPGEAWFWMRRQAFETLIHRVDVETACGKSWPVAHNLAVEGIREVVDFLYPRQIALERTGVLSGTVLLAATDCEERLSIGAAGRSTATISGTAEDLLKMLWGRPHGAILGEGDELLLAELEATALVP